MANEGRKRDFSGLINMTGQAFDASMGESPVQAGVDVPRMVNNRQSVYRVPLSMVRPDRFQARFILPHSLRQAFYSGELDWREVTLRWIEMAREDPLIARELSELAFLGLRCMIPGRSSR